MLDRLLLESDDLGKSQPGQELHVEDFFHGRLDLQQSNGPAAAQVDHRHAAFQLLAPTGKGYTVHRGRGTNLRQADEGVRPSQRQAAGEPRQLGYTLSPAGSGIDE